MNFGQEVYILPIENQERKQILFALLVIVLYLSPLFILGENAHIRVHDNLDSNIAWYKVLSESGELFGAIDAKIPQIMNGLPRNAFGSEFSIIVWLCHLPDNGCICNKPGINKIHCFLWYVYPIKKTFGYRAPIRMD